MGHTTERACSFVCPFFIYLTVGGVMIKINGKNIDIDNINLLEYLKNNNYNYMVVAVELNGNIVKKTEFESTTLHSGDNVEIVSFVGGG